MRGVESEIELEKNWKIEERKQGRIHRKGVIGPVVAITKVKL